MQLVVSVLIQWLLQPPHIHAAWLQAPQIIYQPVGNLSMLRLVTLDPVLPGNTGGNPVKDFGIRAIVEIFFVT